MTKVVCEERNDEGLRFFRDNVCGSIRAEKRDGGDKRVIECSRKYTVYDDYNNRIRRDQNTMGTLTTNIGSPTPRNGMKLIEHNLGDNMCYRIRRLTPKECWRLMGFEDEDFFAAKIGNRQEAKELLAKYPHQGKKQMEEVERVSRISDSQLYKQAGNSIVVDVLYYIMNNLKEAMPYLFENMRVGSFFSGIGAFEKALSKLDTSVESFKTGYGIENDELRQIGFINDCNGSSNRVYDAKTVACTLKAEAGGGEQRQVGIVF